MRSLLKGNLPAIQIVAFLVVAVVTFLVYSQLTVVTYAEGDKPSGYFSVVAASQDAASKAVKYDLVAWSGINEFKRDHPQATFLLPTLEGRFAQRPGEITNASHFSQQASFKVLDSAEGHQTIDVEWDINDDYHSNSKYSTDGTSIKLVSSKLWTPGTVVCGLIFGLIAAWLIGILIRSRFLQK